MKKKLSARELVASQSGKTTQELAHDARIALLCLFLRKDKAAAATLSDIVLEGAEMAAHALSKHNAGNPLIAKFIALPESVRGKPARLKNGRAKDFCETWLTVAAYEVAGGFAKNAGKSVRSPSIAKWVQKSVEAISQTYGQNWETEPAIADVFLSYRMDWKKMLTWEKRQLVRETLKSAARTLKAQSSR